MFTTYPSYYRYRTLYYDSTKPLQTGEDVYALQTALEWNGYSPGLADGILGQHTSAAITNFQRDSALVVDGKAGGATQERLAVPITNVVTTKYGLARKLLYGQISHESSFRLGNYSAFYVDSSSWDSGPAQENSREFAVERAFTPHLSIDDCGARCKKYYEKFSGLQLARRWGLAAAAWNAPATACWIAKHEGATNVLSSDLPKNAPSQAQIDTLESYIDSVTAFMIL